MGNIGDMLRKTRETKGLSLQQVEEETNMRWKYIEALEEENYDVIPGQAYVKGFLRNYSAFLGLNPEEMLEHFKAKYEKESTPEQPEEKRPARKVRKDNKKSGLRLALLVGALLLIILGGWELWAAMGPNNNQQQSKPPEQSGQQANNNPAGQPTTPTPNEQVPQPSKQPLPAATPTDKPQPTENTQGVDITLKATGGQCWIGVITDGQRVFEGFLNNGESKNFKAKDKITIRYGNAGVVEVFQNGKSIGKPGVTGEVVNKEYLK